MGDLEAAVSDFDFGIERDPEDAIAYRGRGVAHRRMGNIEKSDTDFQMAIRYGYDPASISDLIQDLTE